MDTEHIWACDENGGHYPHIGKPEYEKDIPAPMLHELLEVMPESIVVDEMIYIPHFEFGNKSYSSRGTESGSETYREYDMKYRLIGDEDAQTPYFSDSNPANAVVRCLIYLIDNKYVSVEGGKVCLDK